MANYTILLIDYEPRSIERFREPLVGAGYAVEIATDGLSGIEAFHQLNPDMVLVEAMIPKKHGFEVCQELKRTPHGRRTPVIITTGVYKGRKYRTQALHIYGCDEYIEKPIAPQQLLEVVGKFFDSGASAHLPKAGEPSATSLETGGESDPRARAAGAKTSPPVEPPVSGKKRTSATSNQSGIVKDSAEDEIMARLDSILPTGSSAPPLVTNTAAVAIIPASDLDPFAQMRAELDAELGVFSTELPLDAGSTTEPTPELLPSDQMISASVLEALPVPEVEIPVVPPGPATPVVADHLQDHVADSRTKRPRQSKKAERRDKGRSPQVAQVSPSPPAHEPVAPVAMAPKTPHSEVTIPPGSLVGIAVEPPRARRGISAWIYAALGVVAIVATYFVFWHGGASRLDAEASSAPSTGAGPTKPVVATTPSVATSAPTAAPGSDEIPGPAETAPPPVETAPAETTSRVPEPSKVAPERSKPAVNAAKAPVAKKTTDRLPTSSPASSLPKPPVAPATRSGPPNPVAAGTEAPRAAAAADPVSPELDAGVSGVETVADSVADTTVTKITRGALIPIDVADKVPVPVSHRLPVYSDQAKQMELTGTVVMNVLINDRGTVEQVVLVTGVSGAGVNDAALQTAKTWTYRPATKNGVPVKVWKSERIAIGP